MTSQLNNGSNYKGNNAFTNSSTKKKKKKKKKKVEPLLKKEPIKNDEVRERKPSIDKTTEKKTITPSENNNSSTSSLGSSQPKDEQQVNFKKTRKTISFVYPKSDGGMNIGELPKHFKFSATKDVNKEEEEGPKNGEKNHSSDKKEEVDDSKDVTVSKESIDDIFESKKKKKKKINSKETQKNIENEKVENVSASSTEPKNLPNEKQIETNTNSSSSNKSKMEDKNDCLNGVSNKDKKKKRKRKVIDDDTNNDDEMKQKTSDVSSSDAATSTTNSNKKKKQKTAADSLIAAIKSVNDNKGKKQTKANTNDENSSTPKNKSTPQKATEYHHPSTPPSTYTIQDAISDKVGSRPRSNSTDGELNLPRRGLCDETMVSLSYKWNPSAPKLCFKPRGFVNLGNTCFLNATLQCLVYLPTFAQCLKTLDLSKRRKIVAKKQSNQKNNSNTGQVVIHRFRTLLGQIYGNQSKDNGGPLTPKGIVNVMSCLGHKGKHFRLGRQEDAHEFMVYLLDTMKEAELLAAGINPRKSGWRDKLPISRLDETTLIHRLFGGYLRSQMHCPKCDHRSNTYDPYMDLSLEISNSKVDSLEKALKQFTKVEKLDQDNRWKCSGCHKHVCARKQLSIFRPALTLIIHLKRFSFGSGGLLGGGKKKNRFHRGMNGGGYHNFKSSSYKSKHSFGGFAGGGFGGFYSSGYGGSGSKINKMINFPIELSLPLSDGRKCEYVLTGVIVHLGSTATSGHYTAYVRKPVFANNGSSKSQWLYMDDSYVNVVPESRVLKEKDAYVLFYCRKEVKHEFPSPPPNPTDKNEENEEVQEMNTQEKKQRELKISPQSVSLSSIKKSQEAATSSGSESSSDESEDDTKSNISEAKKNDEKCEQDDSESDSDESSSSNSSSSSSSLSESSAKKRLHYGMKDQSPLSSPTRKTAKIANDAIKSTSFRIENKLQEDEEDDEDYEGDSETSSTDTSESDSESESDGESDDDSSSESDNEKDDMQRKVIGPQKEQKAKASAGALPVISPSENSKREGQSDDDDDEVDSSSSSTSSSSSSGESNSESSSESETDTEENKKDDKMEDKDKESVKKSKIKNGKQSPIVIQKKDSKTDNKIHYIMQQKQKGGKKKIPSWQAAVIKNNNVHAGGGGGKNDLTLLGNHQRAIGKWDDDDDDEINNGNKNEMYNREAALKSVNAQEKKRKKSMFVDSWDANLDAGKKKKVKTKNNDDNLSQSTTNFTGRNNVFQRMQSKNQRMNQGSAKGFSMGNGGGVPAMFGGKKNFNKNKSRGSNSKNRRNSNNSGGKLKRRF